MDSISAVTHSPVSSATVPSIAGSARLTPLELGITLAVASLVLVASYFGWWSISVTEAWGFATGGICVWLVVREHIWNWPIGLANNVVFFGLFFQSRLYADMGLQLLYLGLGVYGWINWVNRGKERRRLSISRASRIDWLALMISIPLSTWALHEVLVAVNGAAPFWDSLTTILSLAAQYLLCRKRLENWFFWIVADVIYVPLYLSRGLPLTALLYGVFLVMCLFGIREWNRSWKLRRRLP